MPRHEVTPARARAGPARPPRHRTLALVLGLAILPLRPGHPSPQDPPREYEVKAAFLFNFLKFVEWPEQPPESRSDRIVVGILGTNPFGEAIRALEGKVVRKRTVSVRSVAAAGDAAGCDLVFVPRAEARFEANIIARLGRQPCLLVGESGGFARRGGMIGFYVEENRVRFEINPEATRAAGLTPSSQLLGLARIVTPEPRR